MDFSSKLTPLLDNTNSELTNKGMLAHETTITSTNAKYLNWAGQSLLRRTAQGSNTNEKRPLR